MSYKHATTSMGLDSNAHIMLDFFPCIFKLNSTSNNTVVYEVRAKAAQKGGEYATLVIIFLFAF